MSYSIHYLYECPECKLELVAGITALGLFGIQRPGGIKCLVCPDLWMVRLKEMSEEEVAEFALSERE